MDSSQERDTDKWHRKAKRANGVAIISCFLFAFLWPVDSFFGWFFFGVAAYSGFLGWFYNKTSQPQASTQFGGHQNPFSRPTPGPKTGVRFVVVIAFIMGLVVFGTVAKVVFSGSSEAAQSTTEELTEVDNEDASREEASATDIDVLTNRGNEFYDQGNYDSAMVYYDRVLTFDPSNRFAQYDKALVYYTKKEYGKSVPLLIRCLRENPDYGEAYWLLGDNYYDRQNLDSARTCFARAYLSGLRTGTFLQLMASLYETDDRFKAIELYKESVQQDSTLIDSYRKLVDLDPAQRAAYERMIDKWTPGK